MEAELQDRVVAALDDEADWMGVAERLRRSAGARDVDPVWGIIEAFDYDLKDRSQSEQRERYGGPFGPMIETTAGAYPTLLSEVKDDRLQLWGELFDAVDHPLVRARFGDLIWSRRGGGPAPYRRALAAAEAYVVLADRQGWHAVDRATCLSRALELARELNNPDLRERVIEQIRIAARTSMAATEPQPGVALRLIDALCALPRRDQPAELDDLLDVAAETYEGNPFIHEAVVDLQLARVRDDPDQVKELARKQIATWRAVADRQPGLIRLTHLQRALELARTYGLQPEMEDLRLAVQAISEDDLDLQTISAEIEIPRARIEAFLASFFDGDSWTDWLSRFGAHCPLQEPRDRTVEQVERLIQEHPFQYLMTRVILSPENIPIRIVSTEGEQRQAAIVEWDMRAIVLWAIWAGDVLNDVAVRQRPTVEELTQHFTTEIIPAEVAERVAAAVDHFWEGRYDEALFVLLPRLEAIIRQLCRQLGLVITKEPIGTEAGGFLQLGALLFALTGRLPESRRCYLTTLLTDPIGFNLRNRGLHGLIASGTREDAALAIHAACFLQQVKLEAPAGRPDGTSSTSDGFDVSLDLTRRDELELIGTGPADTTRPVAAPGRCRPAGDGGAPSGFPPTRTASGA